MLASVDLHSHLRDRYYIHPHFLEYMFYITIKGQLMFNTDNKKFKVL